MIKEVTSIWCCALRFLLVIAVEEEDGSITLYSNVK